VVVAEEAAMALTRAAVADEAALLRRSAWNCKMQHKL
jgi:hypothetical protein